MGRPGVALACVVGLLAFWGSSWPDPLSPASKDSVTAAGESRETDLQWIRRLLNNGRFQEAEDRARILIRDAEASWGPDALETAEAIDVLVEALWRGGKSSLAETRMLAERALRIKEAHLPAGDIRIAASLNNLGIVCSDAGDYDAAVAAYRRALAIREGALGPEHPDVARSLNNLGIVSFHRGDYAGARSFHERALAVQEGSLGPEHADVAISLSNLASVFRETGDYAAARPLFERALAIREKALGPEHSYVAMSVNAVAGTLATIGEYEEARELYRRALSIAEKSFAPEHPAIALILSGLGACLIKSGDHAEAKAPLERALAIREKTHDPGHADLAQSLADLADALAKAGEPDRTRSLYERAVSIWDQAVGPGHPSAGHALHNLANLLWERGEVPGAEALHERALAIREKALGPDHPEVAESLASLSILRMQTGMSDRALEGSLRAEEIGRQHLRLTARGLPEREALRYAAVRVRGLDMALSLAAAGMDASRIRSVWDALVRSRALVLDEMAARLRTVGLTSDPEISDLARHLASARSRLANLTVRGPGESEPVNHRRLLEEARKEKENAERALAERSAPFREDLARGQVGLDEAIAALPAGSSLVSFVRYERLNVGTTPPSPGAAVSRKAPPAPAYLAFVLSSAGADAVMVPLGPAREIEEGVDRWRREMAVVRGSIGRGGAAAERRYRASGEALRRRIWDPIEPHVRSSRLVYLVPDGALSVVSWATLPSDDEAYLLQTGPVFHYLAAERDAASPAGRRRSREGLLALGAPDFDAAAARPVAGSGAEAPPRTRKPGPSHRGAPPACGDFRSLRFGPLPEAQAEAEMVHSLWKSEVPPGAEGATVTLLIGADASEGRLKEEAPRHSFLHVATHGFFLGEGCLPSSPAVSRGTPRTGSVGPLAALNPLLLSGLALAGANRRSDNARKDPEGEDGILTAEEIASLDLARAEWVVLSACGSGLGEVRSGEGVLGLRRAFQVAGARTLIMSLWDVDDASARRWIGSLYRQRLLGASVAEAVRLASLEGLRRRKEAAVSTHPFFWGGFIAVGDWR